MKRILFLEDDENRIKKARRAFIGCDVVFVTTARDAIAALAKCDTYGPFDIASGRVGKA